MKRVAVLLTLTLALLLNPVLPRTVWSIANCCHQSLSMTPPQRLNFCHGASSAAAQPGQLQIEAPNCCTATAITLSTDLPAATPPTVADLPVDLTAPLPELRLLTPTQPAYADAAAHDGYDAHAPPGATPPLYLVHTRLNL